MYLSGMSGGNLYFALLIINLGCCSIAVEPSVVVDSESDVPTPTLDTGRKSKVCFVLSCQR